MKYRWKDELIKVFIGVSVFTILSISLLIIGYIIFNGWRALSLDFIIGAPKGIPLGSEGGILPAIMGSLALGGISMLLASLLGLATALYLFFYCKSKRLNSLIRLIVQSIAGIPSIILGLFGYAFFVVVMGLGHSLLAGSLTLSIMIFPVVAINAEKALSEIEEEMLMASYALGISKAHTFFKVVWIIKKRDFLSGILLGTVYAMGATAPIMLTAAVFSASAPTRLSQPVMALPYHLYMMASERISVVNAYGTALVLLVIIFSGYFTVFYVFREKVVD